MRPATKVALAAAAAGTVLPFLPAIQAAEFATHDLRFALRPPESRSPKVVVVAIDDATARAWPEPREFWGGRLARLTRRLESARVRAVGFDLVLAADVDSFLEARNIPESERPNQEFAIELDRSPMPIWLATDNGGRDWADEYSVGNFRWGSSHIPYDRRDTVRMLDTTDRGVPTLAYALAGRSATGDRYWIDYGRRPVPTFSAVRVAEGSVPDEPLRDAVVLVGATFTGNGDVHDSPFGLRDGVAIQAEAVRTLLRGERLTVPGPPFAAILSAVAGGLFGLLAMARSWARYAAICLLGVAVYAATAFAAFVAARWMLPVASPILTVLLAVPLMAYPVREVQRRLDWERAEADRARLRAKWGQMIDDRLVAYVEERRDAGLGSLGTVKASFLFLDVANFSSKSLQLSPEGMLENLNRMFEVLVPAIQGEQGIVLAFTGDGLAAAFDRPPDEERRALRVAQEILRQIDRLNREGAFGGGDWGVRMGLASGPVTLALVGSEKRQTVTYYGEAVNLASRLEQAGKALGSRIVVSDSYAAAAQAEGIALGPHRLPVKGWEAELPVWYVIEDAE